MRREGRHRLPRGDQVRGGMGRRGGRGIGGFQAHGHRRRPSGCHLHAETDGNRAAGKDPQTGGHRQDRGGPGGTHGPKPGDAQTDGTGQDHRRHRFHGVDHRRERDGQGTRGPVRPRQLVPRAGALHRHQLRGHHRDPARKRAFRPRARGLHRRHVGPGRAFRGGQRRDALPGRGGGNLPSHAGEAPAGHPGEGSAPGGGEQDPPGSTCASSAPPTRTCPAR